MCFALAGDRSKASSRVRGYWIAEELGKMGMHCTLLPQHSRRDLMTLVKAIIRSDSIIFQKTYGRYHHLLAHLAKLLGKKVYLDIDDAPSLDFSEKTVNRVYRMMQLSDGVFCGSTHLCQFASEHNTKVHLIESSIRLNNYDVVPTHTNDKICLGWIGNGKYYAEDLCAILRDPLSRIVEKHPIKLKLIGSLGMQQLYETFSSIPNLEIDFIDNINWSDPKEVTNHIKSFDIGLYPLLNNRINHYKCGFKALEYMACGRPVISSKVANNSEIIEHEHSGLIATNHSEWYDAIESLVTSESKRRTMGEAGRAKVEKYFSTKSVATRLNTIMLTN